MCVFCFASSREMCVAHKYTHCDVILVYMRSDIYSPPPSAVVYCSAQSRISIPSKLLYILPSNNKAYTPTQSLANRIVDQTPVMFWNSSAQRLTACVPQFVLSVTEASDGLAGKFLMSLVSTAMRGPFQIFFLMSQCLTTLQRLTDC